MSAYSVRKGRARSVTIFMNTCPNRLTRAYLKALNKLFLLVDVDIDANIIKRTCEDPLKHMRSALLSFVVFQAFSAVGSTKCRYSFNR
jgi:hypothetical protein